MTKILLTGDVHVAEGTKNEYRWTALEDLATDAAKYDADLILVAGDLTDKKDGHSSTLVNRTVEAFRKMPVPVIVLKGNHDYVEPTQPYFGFLQEDWCRFIIEPEILEVGDLKILMLPHTRTPAQDWLEFVKAEVDVVVAHQTFHGASTGVQTLKGISSKWFSQHMERMPDVILSGDVHPPQKIGDVTYIGAPHPVNFGESHRYRFMLLESTPDSIGVKSVWREPIKLATRIVQVDGAAEASFVRLNPGDMVKITVELNSDDLIRWDEIRQALQSYSNQCGVHIQGLRAHVTDVSTTEVGEVSALEDESPEDILRMYADGMGMGQVMQDIGLALLGGRM